MTSPTTPPAQELLQLQDLTRTGHYDAALARIEPLLAQHPEDRDLLHLAAQNLRYLNRIPEALELLGRLEQHHPRCSRLYQERGHCHVTLRDAPRAIEAFRRAVDMNQALADSWQSLHQLYRMTGDRQNAATAAGHLAALQTLPPPIVQAGSLFSDGELPQAEATVRAYLLQHGEHVEALRLLARIGIQRHALDDAERLLESVLELAPDYAAARADYAGVLHRRQKYLQARQETETLLRLEPGNREYLKLYAAACVGLGTYEPIISLYRQLLAQGAATATETADLHLWLADLLKTVGRQPEAIEEYHAAVAAGAGAAWWGLANLKTYRFADEEIARMRTAESAPVTSPVDRYHLCFALGKALETQGRFKESWAFFERGNALKFSEVRHLPQLTEAYARLSKRVCTSEFFAARHGWGVADPDPIFIVGLPRSGSTLVEQILASHPQVEGTQELPEIPHIVTELHGRDPDPDQENSRYPGVLAELGAEDLRKLGERFLTETRAYRQTGRPFFIDKMPNNFRDIGLMHLMLPNARIIDCRREPMACCFGNFKQLFVSGQEFSYNIDAVARCYRTYLDLMRHWHAALPGRILTVHHEDVVENLEDSVRRMLDFCGLPFEPACLEFHKTARHVRTPSSEQVRQPIDRDSLDHWRHYEPWLGPLRAALGDAVM